MRAQSYRTDSLQARVSGHSLSAHSPTALNGGIISEIDYSAEHPVTTHLLLPLLQQLGLQSRWLLWLAPQQKLSRHWLQQSGLPSEKVVQLRRLKTADMVNAMEKALSTGNYSVVLCWLPQDLSEDERIRLRLAAQAGNAYGFIMRPHLEDSKPCRLLSRLKIHSSLYH